MTGTGPHPEFRETGARLKALRIPGGSVPGGRVSPARRIAVLAVVALLAAVAVLAARPRTTATDLAVLQPLPAGMRLVEEVDWCRRDGWRDRTCSAVGFVAVAGGESEAAARDRLVAALTSGGWRVAAAPGLLFRDGAYLRVRPLSEVPPSNERIDAAKARAAAGSSAALQVVLYAWPEVS